MSKTLLLLFGLVILAVVFAALAVADYLCSRNAGRRGRPSAPPSRPTPPAPPAPPSRG